MNQWDALFLGIIQGFTEFLPISSSGHLAIGKHLFGLEKESSFLLFTLVCHLGTLGVILFLFRDSIRQALFSHSDRFWQILLATLPLFPLALLLKPIKQLMNQQELIGPGFLLTSCFLFMGLYCRFPNYKKGKWKDPLVIGLSQAVAIFPGISRSGSTISMAQCLGWEKEEAVRFSFLLAIPAILGSFALELFETLKAGTLSYEIDSWQMLETLAIGFFASFFFGFLALKTVIHLLMKNKWYYFAWYALFVGLATTLYFNV